MRIIRQIAVRFAGIAFAVVMTSPCVCSSAIAQDSAKSAEPKSKLESEPESLDRVLTIESDQKIVDVYALVFSNQAESAQSFSSGKVIKRPAQVRFIRDSTWEIVVKLEPEDFKNRAQFTVVAINENGKSIPTDVQEVQPTPGVSPVSSCVDEASIQNISQLVTLDQKTLVKLIEVRGNRASVSERALRKLLTKGVVESLSKLERDYGLSYPTEPPFSSDLALDKLMSRLSAIEAIRASRASTP